MKTEKKRRKNKPSIYLYFNLQIINELAFGYSLRYGIHDDRLQPIQLAYVDASKYAKYDVIRGWFQ